ncbi:MAG: ABC transporter substrate-binding protein [Anaerolineae bacterium]
MRTPVSRRRFLTTVAAVGGGGALLSACGATPTPQVITQVVTQVVEREVTKIVEGTPQIVKETVVVKETQVVEQVVTATAAPVTGPVTIRFASSIDAGMLEPTQNECKVFSETHPDITVVLEPLPWDGYSEKMVTMVAGGAAPDLTTQHPLWVSFFAAHNVVLALDEMATADADFGADDFFEQVAAYFNFEGKQYGYPYTSWPSVTYFNKTLFDQNSVPLPTEFIEGYQNQTDDWTWEKLLEIGAKLTKGEGVDRTFGLSTGYGGVPGSLSHLCQIVYSYGGEVWNEEMTETRLCEPEAIEAIKFQASLVIDHNIAPLPSQSEGIPGSINSGRYGMWCWNRSEVPGFMNVEFEVGMAPYPRGPVGRVLRDGPSSMAVVSSSKAIPQAWEFLKHMTGPKPGELGGQQYQFENHYAIPSRKSLFNNDVFVSNLLPWESREILEDAAKNVRAMKPPARLSEIDKVYREQWESIILEKATVEEALQTFCTTANDMLKSA